MYSCELVIKTAGLDTSVLDEIKKIQPLQNFSRRYESLKLNVLNAARAELNDLDLSEDLKNKNKNISIVIIDDSIIKTNSDLNLLSELRAFKNTKFILCTDKILNFNEYLEYFYDIWLKPFTPELIKFYFDRLQYQIKLECDLNFYKHSPSGGEDVKSLSSGGEYDNNDNEDLRPYVETHCVEIGRKVDELQHQKRLLEMARQDYLTGLATRWYFQDYIEQNKHEKHLTLIYFDLDHFKLINDTYGHQAGDRALAATAEMMQREFSDGFIARFGGDEFVTILSGRRAISDVENQVNNFIDKLLEYYKGVPTMKKLSISAGIAQTDPEALKSIDQLIHEGDKALYSAKNCGRACCRVYNASMEDLHSSNVE